MTATKTFRVRITRELRLQPNLDVTIEIEGDAPRGSAKLRKAVWAWCDAQPDLSKTNNVLFTWVGSKYTAMTVVP